MEKRNDILETIKEYYGSVLKTCQDLQTSACCSVDALPAYVREIAKEVHPEVKEKFYGCGSPIPLELEGKTVLDLGCGSGRDCYLLSKLVGEKGRVIGVDMTDKQLEVARRHLSFHMDKYGFTTPNIQFLNGYIEDLESIGIKNSSVDVVISNCVINLSPEKERVFSEIFRVLKPGGELYFSDVFSGRRVSKAIQEDPVLRGECLGGALYIEDYRRLLTRLGCADFRTVSKTRLSLNNPEIEQKAGAIDFYSMTIRAFKLSLEDRCEDYGQVAIYLGTVPESPHAFTLDDHHRFEKGKPMLVCGNTALMLTATRYAGHFKVTGDTSVHYGLFDCKASNRSNVENLIGSCC
ncbi:MAG: methyltransferase domain-containing protein [Deltaproteobacteria bacterium]|nr:methyltransferase domain-containing protein [Deltaproteobacteria bacterium]